MFGLWPTAGIYWRLLVFTGDCRYFQLSVFIEDCRCLPVTASIYQRLSVFTWDFCIYRRLPVFTRDCWYVPEITSIPVLTGDCRYLPDKFWFKFWNLPGVGKSSLPILCPRITLTETLLFWQLCDRPTCNRPLLLVIWKRRKYNKLKISETGGWCLV